MEAISERVQVQTVEEGFKSLAQIAKEESHGGKVLLLTEETRRGDDAHAALSLLGLPVARRNLTSATLSDYALLCDRALPENIMAVVGAGGAAQTEAAKAVRIGRSVPRILFPLDLAALSAMDERAFFGTKGDTLTIRSDGHRVLFSAEMLGKSEDVRAGLGYLLARIVEETDDAYRLPITRKGSPAPILRRIKKALLRLGKIREEDAAADIAAIALSFAKDSPLSPASESDGAHLFALLAAKQTGGTYSDYLFPAAYALIRLYSYYLSDLPLEHCPPPDRARNAELLGARCGISASALLSREKEYAEDYEERMRLTAEYREDFREVLAQDLPLSHLARIYRRAERREGSDPLSTGRILSLLSLTGEAVSGYSLIKHIKMTGLIEPLLVAG